MDAASGAQPLMEAATKLNWVKQGLGCVEVGEGLFLHLVPLSGQSLCYSMDADKQDLK
jgi:hypothetical protein